MKVKVTEQIIRSGVIRWQISTSVKVSTLFTLSLTISEILRFEMFDLENVGQGHLVQHSQWNHLVANINFYKSQSPHFTLVLDVFEILRFEMFDIANIGQGHRVQHGQRCSSMA